MTLSQLIERCESGGADPDAVIVVELQRDAPYGIVRTNRGIGQLQVGSQQITIVPAYQPGDG